MLSSTPVAERFQAQSDPALKQKLQHLRRTDNLTNFFYLLRTYLLLGLAIGGAVGFEVYCESYGLSLAWSVPVFAAAVLLIGGLQHNLSGLGHEAAHHTLFRNRYLNELASDSLCMFPMFTTTHHYRLQHLAHHQFVNDPQRDPDVSQLHASGHWDHFPLSRREAWKMLLSQLWLPNLVRFIRVRARYNVMGNNGSPYIKPDGQPAAWLAPLALLGLVAQMALLKTALRQDSPLAAAAGSLSLWVLTAVVFAAVPHRCFFQCRLHPTISFRTTTILRLTYLTGLINVLAWATYLTGRWAALYFIVLWIVPIFTSYAYCMVMRQAVQHGNGSRSMLTNTRVFFMNRVISFCVFPIGQAYHLPHHLFATVPHYRLRQLHEFLLKYPEYREQALEVENYVVPGQHWPHRPTVLDVLGPDYAALGTSDIYVDNTVLDGIEVEHKEGLVAHGAEVGAVSAPVARERKSDERRPAAPRLHKV